ncbi:hypothetical protein [Alcaligenes aquatilis]|uniref:hypothetical protein n=1 Tax=Alcaligenes aquatilis TaxID=323284 RepID=UPI00131F42BC|nr:hypothetical protein [Alcaligenes aquatilis]
MPNYVSPLPPHHKYATALRISPLAQGKYTMIKPGNVGYMAWIKEKGKKPPNVKLLVNSSLPQFAALTE